MIAPIPAAALRALILEARRNDVLLSLSVVSQGSLASLGSSLVQSRSQTARQPADAIVRLAARVAPEPEPAENLEDWHRLALGLTVMFCRAMRHHPVSAAISYEPQATVPWTHHPTGLHYRTLHELLNDRTGGA